MSGKLLYHTQLLSCNFILRMGTSLKVNSLSTRYFHILIVRDCIGHL